METGAPLTSEELLGKLRLTRIQGLGELESGAYWPRLQPYFLEPYFRNLTYQLAGKVPGERRGEALSTRGAGRLGDLDLAYIADRFATVLSVAEPGLPSYSITSVSRGALEYRGAAKSADPVEVTPATGVIYRGLPGARLHTTDDNERLALWIPAHCLEHRLAALLGEPSERELEFVPAIAWESGPGHAVNRLLSLLTAELASPHSFARSRLARESFTDLLLYSLLQSLPHNHTDRLARAKSPPAPRTVRRAEAFIRSRAGQPVALHEVAAAAGCSVRALQLGFRRFRETTPAAAIRQARLEAVQQALARGEIEGTVGEVAHRYGFTNPGRFTSLYRTAFGVSPAKLLRGSIAHMEQLGA